jgi:hypothetical protein
MPPTGHSDMQNVMFLSEYISCVLVYISESTGNVNSMKTLARLTQCFLRDDTYVNGLLDVALWGLLPKTPHWLSVTIRPLSQREFFLWSCTCQTFYIRKKTEFCIHKVTQSMKDMNICNATQDRQCTYNVILRGVRATFVAVDRNEYDIVKGKVHPITGLVA